MNVSINGGVILVAALVLSACAVKPEPPAELPPADQYGSWTDVAPQQTFIAIRGDLEEEPRVVNVNDVLSSEENLRRALDHQFPQVEKVDNLRDRINLIREPYGTGDRKAPAALRGLGGVITDAFLEAVLATLDRDGNFDPRKRVYHFVHGRILHYEYNEISGTNTGSGRLESITYYTRVTVPIGTPNNSGKIISETDAVRWNVAVVEDGFSVRKREYADPNDPFPNTMAFSPAMLNRVEFLGFQFKLWAQGESIKILEVARKNHGATDYTVVDRSNRVYDVTADSCIDMMFVSYPPPRRGTLRPPLYCLGRCEHPEMINTGA